MAGSASDASSGDPLPAMVEASERVEALRRFAESAPIGYVALPALRTMDEPREGETKNEPNSRDRREPVRWPSSLGERLVARLCFTIDGVEGWS